MLQSILDFIASTGFTQVTWQQVTMWAVVLVLFYLAVFKEFEPLLLVPIAFGALIANVPTLGVLNHPVIHPDGTLEVAASIGAIFLILTGCLSEKQAYRGIDWVTIFLFAGMMPIATGLDKSGAGKMIADAVVRVLGGAPSPLAVTASCAFATPVGTPPNTLVLGPGNYRFKDYVKAGTGLVVVCFAVSLVVIPAVWPFFPKP